MPQDDPHTDQTDRTDHTGYTDQTDHAGSADRDLVERFLASRSEADFRALYSRHSPILGRTILRFVGGNQADAEEVLQTAWIRAVDRLDGFRWESSLRSWLTGIALNCSRELIRARTRRQHTDVDSLDLSEAPKIHRQIHRVDLERAIAQLPDGYREVLILHDIEGYTHVDIAGRLGVEVGTSKSQLSRARSAMRRLLHRDEEG